jgi:hydroxypyruvate isomerase
LNVLQVLSTLFFGLRAMVRFSANLSFMYKERFFLSRFGAAKRAGFGAVEFLHHHLDYTPAELGNELREHSLDVSVFNAFPGDWDAGDRGFAARPGYEVALRESVEQALPYADAFGAQRMHVMAGLASSQGALGDAAASCYVENIRWAARRVAGHGLTILIEPINPRDMPGYFLSQTDQASLTSLTPFAPFVTPHFPHLSRPIFPLFPPFVAVISRPNSRSGSRSPRGDW